MTMLPSTQLLPKHLILHIVHTFISDRSLTACYCARTASYSIGNIVFKTRNTVMKVCNASNHGHETGLSYSISLAAGTRRPT